MLCLKCVHVSRAGEEDMHLYDLSRLQKPADPDDTSPDHVVVAYQQHPTAFRREELPRTGIAAVCTAPRLLKAKTMHRYRCMMAAVLHNRKWKTILNFRMEWIAESEKPCISFCCAFLFLSFFCHCPPVRTMRVM